MKTILSTILLLFCVLLCQAEEKPAIHFQGTGWEEVLQNASKQGKQIFLYAYTPSCRYCKQMEKEVFTDQKVADFYNTGFVNFKINIEDGAIGKALAEKYGIVAFPTYMYFDKDGKKLHQSAAAKSAHDFILDAKNASDPEKALFSLQSKYEQGDRSEAVLFNYATALGFYQSSDNPQEKVVGEYLATQSASQLTSETNLRFVFTRYLGFKAATTQYFLANQEKFIPLFPAEEVERKAKRIIINTASQAGRGKDPAMFNELKQIIASSRKDTSRYFSLAQIYFYNGEQDWLNYAKATAKYGKTLAGNDWQTMYETGAYLKAFAKEKETLTIGVQIMEQVIKMNKSYENLCIYASLQSKIGRNAMAVNTAKEAVKLAKSTGEDRSEATELIAELGTPK